MDYTQYNVEDFAADESFVHWVHGSDREAALFWEAFLVDHPDLSVRIMRARTLVLNLQRAQQASCDSDTVESLWSRIAQRVEEAPAPQERSFRPWYYAAAAVFAVVACALGLFYVGGPSADHVALPGGLTGASGEMVEEVNTTDEVKRIFLSDGSAVALASNSVLRYRRDFLASPSREVYLSGEAFFDIARNPAQPFLVHTNDIVTRVLGTSFRVIAPEEEGEIIVAVRTGKVSVYQRTQEPADVAHSHAVILLPNQQVTYSRAEAVFGKSLVREPEIILPKPAMPDFRFENAPINEVFEVLEDAYGIEIIFDEEVMANCFVTAPLGSEPLFEKLRIICRAIGARYETIDARVVITSTGC